ncbi:MAG: histidine kinase [Crocinitomicaceae bacterium]
MKTYVKYSLIAWLLFAAIVTWVFLSVSDLSSSILRVLSFVVPQMALFYLNLIWLSCSYLEQKRKKTYYLLLFLLIALHVVLFVPVDFYLDQYFPLDIPHFQERPVFFVYMGRFMTSIPPIIISALIWKSLQLRRRTEESLELKNKMLDAETKALKAQINPHFLFNSLNNIYSLSQVKSEKTGDAILHLSEILRFVTYESEKDKVNIKDELKQIHNFIQLQFLKDENQENVRVEIGQPEQSLQIAPMLLLPFIENSFKHSNFEDKSTGWIDIHIQFKGSTLSMHIKNSSRLDPGQKDKVGGVGMENVKKRLSLIYPGKHQLKIKETPTTYEVKLELKLS